MLANRANDLTGRDLLVRVQAECLANDGQVSDVIPCLVEIFFPFRVNPSYLYSRRRACGIGPSYAPRPDRVRQADAPYLPGKRAMIKVKHARTADCVVAGFRWYKAQRRTLVGSLLLGLYDDQWLGSNTSA